MATAEQEIARLKARVTELERELGEARCERPHREKIQHMSAEVVDIGEEGDN